MTSAHCGDSARPLWRRFKGAALSAAPAAAPAPNRPRSGSEPAPERRRARAAPAPLPHTPAPGRTGRSRQVPTRIGSGRDFPRIWGFFGMPGAPPALRGFQSRNSHLELNPQTTLAPVLGPVLVPFIAALGQPSARDGASMRRCCQGVGLPCLFKGVGMSGPHPPLFLLVFDFDETIVDENSDDSVLRGRALPEPLRHSPGGSYNEHMQRALAFLGEQGVRPAELRAVYENIPLSPGMAELFQLLSKHQELFELVLISDANTFGVEAKLRAAGARSLFRKVFSNPASFDRRGVLTLGPYHSHKCLQCPANMCKRKILGEYLAERAREDVEFQRVFYVGDGANDFCPAGTLTAADVAFPRKGYPMHRLIQESQEKQPGAFQAAVVPWESAVEVARYLQELLRRKC